MKKFILFFALFCSLAILGQSDGITYQAVILDPEVQELPGQDNPSNVLIQTDVALRFTISTEGTVLFQETQQTRTDDFGMINVVIGNGTQSEGTSFTQIVWDGTPKDLAVEISMGGQFESLSTQPLLFIPYAFHRDIIASGNMIIEGTSQFDGDLTVNGTTTLNNSLLVANETMTDLSGELNVQGTTLLKSSLEVANESPTQLSGTLTVDGVTQLEDDLSVEGNNTVNGGLIVAGDSQLQANLVVGQNATISENLQIEGNTVLNNTLTVANGSQTNLTGTLDVTGNALLNNTLQVEGAASFNNPVVVSNNQPTVLGGTLTVEREATFNDDFIINGETIMNNGLQVNGDSQLNGNVGITEDVNVEGAAYLESQLEVQNGSSSLLSGLLKVEGESILDNTLTVAGDTQLLANLEVDQNVSISQDLQVNGVTYANGILNVNNESDTNLSGVLNVAGISNLNNELNVAGISNLNNVLNVNNGSESNLSGILNVEGVSNLNNELNVLGAANLENSLNVTGISNLNSELNVEGETTINGTTQINDNLNVEDEVASSSLVVSGGGDIMGNHVALFENTSGSDDADGIAIKIDNGTLSIDNHFVSFYGSGSYLAGRIESYDLLGGDLWESFPVPDFNTLINVFDFTQVLEWEEPSLDFNAGSFPTLNPGSLPELDIDFDFPDGLDWDFDDGSLPSLNGGSPPSADFDTGSLNLNFDGFFDLEAGSAATSQIGAMVGWGYRNGNPGFIPTSPAKIALATVILAAQQVARNQGIVYGSKGADYAEWLEKENPEDTFVFGEIVGVKGGKVSKNTTEADHVMSISLNPIVLGNMPDDSRQDEFEKVGFMGQVPALVVGEVVVGDFILASGNNDGYGIAKSPKAVEIEDLKNIIGRAWSKSDPSGLSIINVSVGLKTNEWIMIFEKQQQELTELQGQLKKLESLTDRLEKMEAAMNALGIH